MLPLRGSSGAAPLRVFGFFFFFFIFLFSPPFSHTLSRVPFAPSFPADHLPLECPEILTFLHLFSIYSPLLPQHLSLHHFPQSQVSVTQFVLRRKIMSGHILGASKK